jgi:hypothetical protein
VLGKGSAQLQVPDNSDVAQSLRTTVLDGKPLGDLRALTYSTYAEKGAGDGAAVQNPAYVTFAVDADADGTKDATLFFEPAVGADPADITNGVWKSWNALDGKLRVVPVTAGPAQPLQTLAAYLSDNPKAKFVADRKHGGEGALSIVAGATGDAQRNATFGVDNVSIGTSAVLDGKPAVDTTTYDFEATYTTPGVADAKRNGPGDVTVTGKAGAGDKVELRTGAGWTTVLGTATANAAGDWTLAVPGVTATTAVRAWLADTFGTLDIASAAGQLEVTSLAPSVANVTRKGAGPVALSGKAVAGDRVEVRTGAGWTTVLGTATADAKGDWTLPLAEVSRLTLVRAWLGGTFGSTDVASPTARIQVAFAPTLTLTTKGGFVLGTVTANPGLEGATVRWEQRVGKNWVTVQRTLTDATGVATLEWDTVKGRTYQVRAAVSADPAEGVRSAFTVVRTVRSS